VNAVSFDGVSVSIESLGGINTWDVHIGKDDISTRRTAPVMASPAYDIAIPAQAAFTSATLTIPYRSDLLDGFPESDLRIYHLSEETGLWVSAGPNQIVDTGADTVSVSVDHFSTFAVMKLGPEGFEVFWPTKEVFCIQEEGGTPQTGIDLAFLIDQSGSMSVNDPNGLRVDGAHQFVDAMDTQDVAAVVGFTTSAFTRIGLTQLDTTENRDAVHAALEETRPAGGGTSITAPVEAAIDLLSQTQSGRPRVALLLTDGVGSYDNTLTEQARQANIVIHTVGLGSSTDPVLLQQIASGTGGTYRHLNSAEELPAMYDEIADLLIDDGTDSDGDGLTDCEETHGMLVTWGFWDTSIDPQNEPFVGDHRITSDPQDPDTDGDGLTDGEELLGRNANGSLGSPLDLRDNQATVDAYGFLIDAGITKYFIMRSDPNDTDSDGDSLAEFFLGDFEETRGTEASNGIVYTSRPDRIDTDFDGNIDPIEYLLGTDPLFADPSEVGIPGLAPLTLFQPEQFGTTTVVNGQFRLASGALDFVQYNDEPITYDSSFNCVSGDCNAITAHATTQTGSAWCWLPWNTCPTDPEAIQDLIREAVELQGVFTLDGQFQSSYMNRQAVGECLVTVAAADRPDCADMPFTNTAAAAETGENGEIILEPILDTIADILLNMPGGFRPQNVCGNPDTNAGTYRLIDPNTQEVKYVGMTNNFNRRRVEHEGDPRFEGLEFQVQYRTTDRHTRWALEQRDYNDLWGDVPYQEAQALGSLNRRRPMASANTSYSEMMDLAQYFIDVCL